MQCVFFCVFFFKQKTAYEMRISDWSSDVCSSDLMDHKTRLRPKPDPHKNVSSATGRVAARITAIMNDRPSGQAFKDLFELRSAFVHGRTGLQKVSTAQRVLARSLARSVRAAWSILLRRARALAPTR